MLFCHLQAGIVLQEEAAKLEEFEATKQKRSKKEEEKNVEEKSTLHGT